MSKAKGTRSKIAKAEPGPTRPTAGPKSTDGAKSSRQSEVKGVSVRDTEHEPSETPSRTVLDAIIRNTDAMLVYLDRDFNFVAVNPAYARSCRVRTEELIGKNHFALYPHAENEAIFRRVRDTGEPAFYRDKPFEFPDQPERGLTYWDWSLAPVKDVAGNVTGLVFSLRETTDRRRAEEALRQSESRLRLAQISAGAGIWNWDIATGRLEWSEELFRLFGLDPETDEASFDVWRHVVHPDDRLLAEKRIEAAVETRVPLASEYRIVLPSGEVRWIDALGNATYDGNGKPQDMSGICIDVTERKRAEEALRAVALFPEQNLAPILRVSHDGTLLYGNLASACLLQSWGCEKGEAVPDAIVTHVRAALDGDQMKEAECVYEQTLYSFSIVPIVSDGYANLYGRDVTDRRRAEAENKRNETRLESLLRISQHHADSMTDLLDFALDEAIVLTGSQIGYVYHYDEAKQEFTLNSWSKDVMRQCRVVEPQTVYQLDKTGVWGEAVRQRAPIVINDFQAYHPLKKGYPREHVPISRYMTVPVFSEGHIVGVIGVANKATDYDDSDVRQLTLLMESVWRVVERKKAEQALRESEERYRSLFNEMTEGFALHEMVCDEAGRPCDYRFLQVNPAFEQLTGLKRQDVEGRLVSDILPDEVRHWVDLYAPVALNGESVHLDDFSPRLGKYYEIFAYCPAPRRFAVLFLDISERRLAEKRVRDSEQRLRLALEGGRMGYWERDFHDDTNMCSDHVFEVLGLELPQTEASSDRFLERVHPDDRAALERLLREAVADETDFHAEFRIVRPDGQVAWLASRAKIIRDEEGRAGRMMGVIYDISQRKEMETELRRLNEHLERQVEARTEELAGTVDLLRDEVTLRENAEQELHLRSKILEGSFQHTMTPVAFMDKQFNFIRVNDAFAKADEKVPEEFVGKNYFDLFSSEKDKAIFEQVVRTKGPFHAFAKPLSYFHASAGATTYWNWLLTPLLDDNGEVEFLVLNLENVTERQLAFEELEKRALQLQRLTLELSQAEDRERQRLAEVLHDDLQQLLVGAKLHLNILANRTGDDEELADVVGQVRKLITESIDKSRGLSHELSPPLLQQGGLSEALAWLAQQMRTTCGLAVQVDASGDAEVGSEALRTFVYKAAQEMLFNVVKHARVKRARVELRRLSGYVRLVVSDEGQGFDTRLLTERGGVGFGLFSIRERVQLLGGWMKFKSTPGKGSVFVLAIPDSAQAAAVTNDVDAVAADAVLCSMVQAPAVRHLGSRRIRVLLVDDHKVMRQGIAVLLDEEPDIEVVGQAGNGRDAVTLAGQLHPDVIVMDMAMPVLSGDEATRQIRIQLPATRIIGLSISEPGSVSERMLQAGAEAFLSKNDPSEKLLAAIRGLTWHD